MMAYGKNQRLRFKRRRNGETDYRRRMKMLRGGVARAVVRVTNTQTICQLVNYETTGDTTQVSIDGSTLVEKHGWPIDASRKSIPASYVAGYAMAKAAISAGTMKQFSILVLRLQPLETGCLQLSREWWMLVWRYHTVKMYYQMTIESMVHISMTRLQKRLRQQRNQLRRPNHER